MCFSVERMHWDVQFCRLVHDWELESLVLFMNITLSTVHLCGVLVLTKFVGS